MKPWVGWKLSAGVAVTGAALYAYRRRRALAGRRAFNDAPLESMVGAGTTDRTSVRIWGRTSVSGRHQLTITPNGAARAVAALSFDVPNLGERDGTFAVRYPSDFQGARPLTPATRYVCAVRNARDQYVGECEFETAPADAEQTPSRFAIAAMSCHLPFDDWGNLSQRAERLLHALPARLRSYNAKRVLLMGDQVYGDLPKHCSLFRQEYFQSVGPAHRKNLMECTREEVRSLYQHRHRIFWKSGGLKGIQSSFACHTILDDHEILDNFGSSPAHTEQEYAALKQGALDAFYDYQAQRTLQADNGERPPAFYHGFEYGTVGVFVMDLRSERHVVGEKICVYSDRQLASLQKFLARCSDKHVVFLVLSVPILHVPDWLATLGITFASNDGDLQDRWSNPQAHESRNRLLALIRDHQRSHPNQRIVLLGGDVHVGAAARFHWGDGIRDTYQLVSSAVSNVSEFNLRRIAEVMPNIDTDVGDDFSFSGQLLPDMGKENESAHCNPYGDLNCGVVLVERIGEAESTVRLLLLGCSDENSAAPQVVFDSGAL